MQFLHFPPAGFQFHTLRLYLRFQLGIQLPQRCYFSRRCTLKRQVVREFHHPDKSLRRRRLGT